MDDILKSLQNLRLKTVHKSPIIIRLKNEYKKYCEILEQYDDYLFVYNEYVSSQEECCQLELREMMISMAKKIAHIIHYYPSFEFETEIPGIEFENDIFLLANEFYDSGNYEKQHKLNKDTKMIRTVVKNVIDDDLSVLISKKLKI